MSTTIIVGLKSLSKEWVSTFAPTSARNHNAALKNFFSFASDNEVSYFGVTIARKWVNSLRNKGYSDKTVYTYTKSVRAFFKWLDQKGYYRSDIYRKLYVNTPCKGTYHLKNVPPLVTIPGVDINKVNAASAPTPVKSSARDQAMVLLQLTTNLSDEEIIGLKVGDVIQANNTKFLLAGQNTGSPFSSGIVIASKVAQLIDAHLSTRENLQTSDPLFASDTGQPITMEYLSKAKDLIMNTSRLDAESIDKELQNYKQQLIWNRLGLGA